MAGVFTWKASMPSISASTWEKISRIRISGVTKETASARIWLIKADRLVFCW